MFKIFKFVGISMISMLALMSLNVSSAANAPLDCQVCVNALQTELTKGNDNFIEFAANAPDACAGATNVDDQKVACAVTLIKNSKQLFKDEKNAVPPMTSCINIGAQNCMPNPTTPPTKTPTTAPSTKTPTTAPPTKIPTTAPPTKIPAPPTKMPPTKMPTTATRRQPIRRQLYLRPVRKQSPKSFAL